jgi:hypothetical protein
LELLAADCIACRVRGAALGMPGRRQGIVGRSRDSDVIERSGQAIELD